jgi:Ca-activated chloride channel family protein
MFRFATPYAFLLLVLIPLIVWTTRRRRRPVMAASSVQAATGLASSPALMVHRLLPLMYYGIIVLLITALARPQWGTRRVPISAPGINIILALDLSESMAALDFQDSGKVINRLAAVKKVVADFISKRSTDRIGVVVFGSQAYTQLPLTRDYETITEILDRLKIGAAGRSTAIGDAIGISLKRLKDIKSRSNVIILLTDGRSNSGKLQPDVAAEIARKMGVKIYAIGIGSKGRVPFLVDDPIFGQRYVYQQADLDEGALKAIAKTTGGLYFRAQGLKSLQKIYDTIDAMVKTNVKVQSFAEYNELFFYPLIPAFVLLVLWIGLKNTRFVSIP